MGITLNLKQVSPYVLEKIKKYPDLSGLFLDAKYLEDSSFWQNFSIIERDDIEWFHEAINFVQEGIDKFKKDKTEEFEKIKDDITLIINEGKGEYLDLDKMWQPLIFLLTGYDFYDQPLYLSKLVVSQNPEDNLPLIRAVIGSNGIEHYERDYPLLYFNDDEVRKIADALSNFSIETIRKRLQFRSLEEDSYHHLYEYAYNPLVRYYQDAAEKGNAMFLHFS
ncbi:hypothetical protein Ava_2601 [Trichormus variabilis ATCC 29413]|uniref:DUF1877 domain-containing protein n=7 Tax=Anabaena variabilis TaxID=264691 RepID=Q3M9X0_TRIV2|nr:MULTISPECIES: DUF1877 family protein [Nostocaceae]ABA22216.1 hypothetical protein Ava_2601 [Trichormus variabilis ATCC 29413]MBC1301243.1 DUF1877 family protein [Trichormus variabilis N2B]MBC1309757.1 DUF1877 family protein [Trichormus variabilis PNB]MBC1324479.1 DUF1877 family protein [Trichormus variabilis 9RC]MBD2382210.1 DUF1877 family protein [Trichormus variabilis FACHB-319]